MQVCEPSMVHNITAITAKSDFALENVWVEDVNGYPNVTDFNTCGLLAGEDII